LENRFQELTSGEKEKRRREMWGFGGKYYWGGNEMGGKIEGIVVVFAWMSSQERHLRSYVQLYSSLGWKTLVCHSEFLNS
jgi:hypothetical protein